MEHFNIKTFTLNSIYLTILTAPIGTSCVNNLALDFYRPSRPWSNKVVGQVVAKKTFSIIICNGSCE